MMTMNRHKKQIQYTVKKEVDYYSSHGTFVSEMKLDRRIQIVKFFRFRFLFYTFLIFPSSLKVQTNSPQPFITTAFITKTPLTSKPEGVRCQWCFCYGAPEGIRTPDLLIRS